MSAGWRCEKYLKCLENIGRFWTCGSCESNLSTENVKEIQESQQDDKQGRKRWRLCFRLVGVVLELSSIVVGVSLHHPLPIAVV